MKSSFLKKLITVVVFSHVMLGMAVADDRNDVSISDITFGNAKNGLCAVYGKIHNKTGNTLKTVMVTLSVLKNGEIIGKAEGVVFNLKPMQDQKLEADINNVQEEPDDAQVYNVKVLARE